MGEARRVVQRTEHLECLQVIVRGRADGSTVDSVGERQEGDVVRRRRVGEGDLRADRAFDDERRSAADVCRRSLGGWGGLGLSLGALGSGCALFLWRGTWRLLCWLFAGLRDRGRLGLAGQSLRYLLFRLWRRFHAKPDE